MKIVTKLLAATGIAALAACGQPAQDDNMVVENLTVQNLIIENEMGGMDGMDMNMTQDNQMGMNDMNAMDDMNDNAAGNNTTF
jgi:outer membrane lipopolysaccharide assembly protein LptE/RlpB